MKFSYRHIGPSDPDLGKMLRTVRAPSLDALIAETIPAEIRQPDELAIGAPMAESDALARARAVASMNVMRISLIGQGYYGSVTPPVIQRNVLENPAWYTAYTPYQPEISQGRLEALLNFQTMTADLTGLPIANASLLDEPTAAAEAMAMARRIGNPNKNVFFIDRDCHPQTIAVVVARAEPLGWKIVIGDPLADLVPGDIFAALIQYPGSSGALRDLRGPIADLHAHGVLAVVAADLLALALVVPPGELGADIAIGSTQRFGLPLGYGGPHAAYIATKNEHARALPGRLVGVTIDRHRHAAFRLALQTREQHIRREKATSNICTAQVLPAVIASMYAVYHGPEGLTQIAQTVARQATALAAGLRERGWSVLHAAFFDTIAVDVGAARVKIMERADDRGINLRSFSDAQGRDLIGVSCDETTTPGIIEAVWDAFGSSPELPPDVPTPVSSFASLADLTLAIPKSLLRTSPILLHPIFHLYRSETELMRYIRRLGDRDLALDRTMIPLGSCTMKLNAAGEMIPISWPEFANVHPFTPSHQATGYGVVFKELAEKLCAITGYDAMSLQPNSGAQGEYAGLLAIRAYFRCRGQSHRNLCLIPHSAHGTNPASAQMAGMEVLPVACDGRGNIDIDDLRAKAESNAGRLAAIMITYPSTHGVFEPGIRSVCEIVHANGGQVYLDGANLNAQVGLTRPGDYGADIGHLNLHKTFCIPHGGGGPGMGPVGAKKHLAPFLPGHALPEVSNEQGRPVAGAPYGSALILVIPWIYLMLMGSEGLTLATKVAILNANYIATRLAKHYPLLYRGTLGRVAHECILDVRHFKDSAGITVDDIAKRLIDYGFHAPTVSFPVPGTLMIEPTESESKAELDRFCDALIKIRAEIRAVENGRLPRDDNPLVNAPHTIADLLQETWTHPYTRILGCMPSTKSRTNKYWSPVSRIDGVFGDRNLQCSCPPIDSEQEAAE